MKNRVSATPRLVRVLTQSAFERKTRSGSSLAIAKNEVAKEYGFRDWQHLKDLEKKGMPTPLTLRANRLWLKSQASVSSDQGCNSFEVRLLGSSYDDDEDDDEKAVTIGTIRGRMWTEGKRSLFDTFDPISQELADFAEYFEHHFEDVCDEYVGRLAYIEELHIDSQYNELEFGKLLLKAFFNRLGTLVEAIFAFPMPSVHLVANGITTIMYDRSKQSKTEHAKIFLDLGFEAIPSSDYFYVHNAFVNKALDEYQSPSGDEDD